jgi:hypothetical protein
LGEPLQIEQGFDHTLNMEDRHNERAAEMVKRGADTIVLASCITKGNPHRLCLPSYAGNGKCYPKEAWGVF